MGSSSLSEKLAATLAEAVANFQLMEAEDVDHDGWKQLQVEQAEVDALELELKELEHARKYAATAARLARRAEKARLLAESGLEGDEPVSNEAMMELEDGKMQLEMDRWNFNNDSFQLKVLQAQLGGESSITDADKTQMIPARELDIRFGDKPDHWKWTSVPETRYAVAELLETRWYQMYGSCSISRLFPYTTYAAYLVFKLTEDSYGFDISRAEASAGIDKGQRLIKTIYLVAEEEQVGPEGADEYPTLRPDGWMEVELGTFFVAGDEDGEIKMSFLEIFTSEWRKGLIVLGIELRPKLSTIRN